VNLELPLVVNERLDGHIVLGHVDTTVPVLSFEQEADKRMLRVRIPQEFLKYIIPVGSLALDGASLTVANIDNDVATVAIIPHTFEHTIIGEYAIGTSVNAEFDVLGKYVERMISGRSAATGPGSLSLDYLKELGY
jgi:riboflavin synthase